jgi:hypothetical protein
MHRMNDTQAVSISRFPAGTSVLVTGDNTVPRVVLQNANGEPAENRGFVLATAHGKHVATLDGRLHSVDTIEVVTPTIDQVPAGTIVRWNPNGSFEIMAEISSELIRHHTKDGRPFYIKIEDDAGFVDLSSGAHTTFSDLSDDDRFVTNAYDHDIMDVFFEGYLKDAGYLEK